MASKKETVNNEATSSEEKKTAKPKAKRTIKKQVDETASVTKTPAAEMADINETWHNQIIEHIKDVNEAATVTSGLVKELDNRIDALEKREQHAKKSLDDIFNRFNARINSLECPKAAIIEIKSTDPSLSVVVPTPSKDGSIGDDIVITKDIWVEHGRNVVPLDISINLPRGIEAKIEARSGFSARGIYGKVLRYISDKIFFIFHKPAVEVEAMENVNADVITGKIDPGYHDGLGVIIYNRSVPFMIPKGTRIAQITYYKTVNHRYKVVEEFSENRPYVSNRGGGFGSSETGKNA